MLRNHKRQWTALASTCLLVAGLLSLAPAAAKAEVELVMFEEQGCAWCRAWHEEIGVIYPKTDESDVAPLRRVDIHDARPEDLQAIKAIHFTPTFVLIDDGREVARLVGYPGEDFFWPLLAQMLEKLPGEQAAPAMN